MFYNKSNCSAAFLVSICLAGLLPSEARAGDTWTTPFTGVKYLYRTTSTPWRIHALVVDLCAAGVSLRATTSQERKLKTSSFATLVGAEAAINGDFFSYSTYGTSGLAVGNGAKWGDTGDSSGWSFIGFGPDRAYLDPSGSTVSTLPAWLKQAVGGQPHIVVAGAVVTSYTSSVCAGSVRHPRTAVGLSQDGRTLYLAVVDGRWSQSVGMSCAELGTLMASLGAYNALNLDGGGSSTMWIKGKGIANHPSDASGERTVANHLAVMAKGTGLPGSCDYVMEELDQKSGVYGDEDAFTDINGDGKADACARDSAGIRCNLGASSSASSVVLGPTLSNASGWSDVTNYSTLRFGDLNGDGKADLCAREDAGMRCWLSSGTGFSTTFAGPVLSDAAGFNKHPYYSTIRLADVTGDGKDDLCVRAAAGFFCYPSTGAGFSAALTGPALSDAAGWNEPQYYGTIRLGDINGDARHDVCARGAAGVSCWLATGTGFSSQAIAGPAWSDAQGWGWLRYYSTLRLADLNGDGKADLCARSSTALSCYLSSGSGFPTAVTGSPTLADADGWGVYQYFSTLRFADYTGDGKADACIRGAAGLQCWASTGTGFGSPIATGLLDDKNGWGSAHYFQTLRLADINGDARADLCARGSAGVTCWPSDGKGFPVSQAGPGWASSVGWDAPQYYSTIRLAGPRCHPKAEVCDGKDNNCNGQIDEGGVCPPKKDGGPWPDGPNPKTDGLPIKKDSTVPKMDGPQTKTDGLPAKSDGPLATSDLPHATFDIPLQKSDGSASLGNNLEGGCGCSLTPTADDPARALLLFLVIVVLLGFRRKDGIL